MSDELQQDETTFEQIAMANRDMSAAKVLWDKAHKILTRQPKILKFVEYGDSTFAVSPKYVETVKVRNVGETEIQYAIAALTSNRKLTETYFIVVNDNFDSLVQINHLDKENPLTTYDMRNKKVKIGDIEKKLDSLIRITDEAARNYKSPAKRARDKSRAYVKPVVVAASAGVVFLGAVFGVNAWHHWLGEDNRYALEFDAAHPGYVIEGTTIQRGEELLLKGPQGTGGVLVPRAETNDVLDRARWTRVAPSSCHSSATVRTAGYVKEGERLIAQTNAPDGAIRVRVAEDGQIDFCAYNPEKLSFFSDKMYDLTLQIQPSLN